MPTTAHEIEGQVILAKLKRTQKSEAILAEPAAPGAIVIGFAAAITVGLANYLLQDLSLPIKVSAALDGILCAGVMFGIEQWSLRRRLEALIELIKAERDSESKQ